MTAAADFTATLEARLDEAVTYQEWLNAAGYAAQLARSGDDWNNREMYLGLSQTYATMAQAAELNLANRHAAERQARENSTQFQKDELNAAIVAIARAVQDIATR